jgi:hemolysin activation/secretion protein
MNVIFLTAARSPRQGWSRQRVLIGLLTLAMAPLTGMAAPDEAGSAPRFDILEFVVQGNTVLSDADIERLVYPFLGPDKTLADAEGARQALEKAYQQAGYLSVVVELPPQKLDARGELLLQVVEAPVERLRITGAQYHLPSRIREQLPSLTPGTVPNFHDMQDEMALLAQQTGDRELTPLLTAGSEPGQLDVEIKVKDKAPLHGRVELNSAQSRNTDRGRMLTVLSYDNLFQRQHSLGMSWLVAPTAPNQSNNLSLNYSLPLGGPGDSLLISVSHSNSDTPTVLGGASISRGETYRLSWRDSLQASGSFDHALNWGITWRDNEDRSRAVAGFDIQGPRLKYPTVNTSYELTDFGNTQGQLFTLELGLEMGLPGLGKKTVDCGDSGVMLDQFDCARAGASPRFMVLNLDTAYREPFGAWSLMGRLRGQFADGPLVSAHQFVAGGTSSVRGYLDGEQAGDTGVSLRVELNTPPLWQDEQATLSALAFNDRAYLRKFDTLPGERDRFHLGSWGLGLRFDARWGMSASLDWARLVFDPIEDTATRRGRDRWELSVSYSF